MEDKNIPTKANIKLKSLKLKDTLYKVNIETGIYIPETATEKTQKAEVVEIGESEDIKVKKGDIVIYDKYAGIQIKDGDTEYLIVKNEEIVALIKK